MAPSSPSYVTHHFGFVLDGADGGFVGWLRSVEGGAIKAEVVKHVLGAKAVADKRIGIPTYEPFTVQTGMSMAKGFYDWIQKSWDGEVARKSGSMIICDRNLKPQHEQEFRDALITETTLPTLDGSSKEAANLTVKFQAEQIENKISDEKSPPQTPDAQGGKPRQKVWLPSNFRFTLDGMEEGCRRVAKIDSFTVKQGVKRLETGAERNYQLEPSSLEFPNLSLTFSIADADKWFEWHDRFVIKGNNSTEQEKNGSITYLSPNREDELMRVDLFGVGISNLVIDKGTAQQSDAIKRVKVELYVESMKFNWTE